MEPKTANINARGGMIIITTLNQNFKSNLPLNGTGGATPFFILAKMKT